MIPTGSAKLATEIVGEGPDVLLLHAGVADRRAWRPLVERLAPTNRCICFDARGHGQTTYQPEPFSRVGDAVAVLDSRRSVRLFPTGTFSRAGTLAALFAAMIMLNSAIVSDIFVPLFLQDLHGQSPLVAGYLLALTAVGWSAGSIIVSTWTGARERIVLTLGPVLQLAGLVGLALFIGRYNVAGDILPLVPIAIGLLLLGTGIGIAWPHISARVLAAAPSGEGDLTSASISMVQLFASGFGAAIAGVIVNAAGLAGGSVAGTISAANWLYALFAVAPLIAIPPLWSIARTERAPMAVQPAE